MIIIFFCYEQYYLSYDLPYEINFFMSMQCSSCLDPKFLHPKISHRMFGHMHGVLNEIYLQNFLYG